MLSGIGAIEGEPYTYTHVGLSALLVSTSRAMRRPTNCGTGKGLAPRSFVLCIKEPSIYFCCGSRAVHLKKRVKMKKFLVVAAAVFAMNVTSVFAQTKDAIQASVDRCAKLEKLCAKTPKKSGVSDVDTYVTGVLNAAQASITTSQQLQDLYYRQIGETKDGVTDVTVKKPTVEELVAFGATLTAEGVSIANAAKGAEGALKASKEVKNPMKVAKIASALAFTKDAYPILLEESTAKVEIIKQMIETAKSSSNQ